MKALRYFAAAAALVALAACNKEDMDLGGFSTDSDAVQITAGVGTPFTRSNPAGTTEADRTKFNAGDRISVKAEGQDAVTYTLTTGVWTPEGGKYLKWNAASETFSAYYPADIYDGTQTTVPADQHEEGHIAQADYMKSEGVVRKKSEGAVSLMLSRQTARIAISKIIWEKQYGADMQNIFSLVLCDGVSGDIKPYKAGSGTYYALLMPGNGAADETFIKVTVWDGNTEASKQDLIVKGIPALEAGKSYECSLTLGKELLTLSSVTVMDWTSGGVIGDDENMTEEHLGYTVTETEGVKTYIIHDEAGLSGVNRIMASDVNELSSNIILAANITLTGENNWTPIGNERNPYTGTFDGNGKTITGLHINNGSASYQGLIGYLVNGTVKDLTLADSRVTGRSDVGGVAGIINNLASITNVTVKDCEIHGNTTYVGGVIGSVIQGTISGATLLDSKVTSYGTNVGGIVGYSSGSSIENCLVQSSAGKTVTIDVTNNCAGGIVGYIRLGALISGCKVINDGVFNVRAGNQYAGGIAGEGEDCEIVACLVSEVNVTASACVGGIVGQSSSSCNLSGSYAYDCTTGTTPDAFTGVANIVGTNEGTVTSCYYHAYNDSWEDLVTPVPNSSGEFEPGTPVDWTTASENMNRNLTGYIWGGTYDAPTLTAR